MLRRSSISLIAPLPLYKVGIVLIRQFAKPVVQEGVNLANQYPAVRRTCIYVGWYHYRLSVYFERMLWGAEQRAKEASIQDEKSKDAVKDKVVDSSAPTPSSKDSATTDKDSTKSSTTATTTSSSVGGGIPDIPLQPPIVNLNISLGTEIPPPSPSQQQQPSSNDVNSTSSSSSLSPPSSSSSLLRSKIISTASSATTPRSVKILPTSFPVRSSSSSSNPTTMFKNPLKKVRKIFIAPPRPSDDELLQKGMRLLVEVAMFCIVLCVILYEMLQNSVDKEKKRKLLEDRFRRLERHVIHHKDCGCPKGVKDGEVCDVDELEKRLDDFVPARRKKVCEGIESDEDVLSNNKKNKQQAQQNTSLEQQSSPVTVSSNLDVSSKRKDEKKVSSPSTDVSSSSSNAADKKVIAPNASSATHHHHTPHHLGGGQIVRIPSSISDLIDTWLALPIDVQFALTSVFAIPYCIMTLLIVRLFMLVKAS